MAWYLQRAGRMLGPFHSPQVSAWNQWRATIAHPKCLGKRHWDELDHQAAQYEFMVALEQAPSGRRPLDYIVCGPALMGATFRVQMSNQDHGPGVSNPHSW